MMIFCQLSLLLMLLSYIDIHKIYVFIHCYRHISCKLDCLHQHQCEFFGLQKVIDFEDAEIDETLVSQQLRESPGSWRDKKGNVSYPPPATNSSPLWKQAIPKGNVSHLNQPLNFRGENVKVQALWYVFFSLKRGKNIFWDIFPADFSGICCC